jgi:urease accessory protein
MTQMKRTLVLVGAALAAMSVGAEAHPGHLAASGLAAGFIHPFTGFDHVIAMVAVGILAARLGGRALWAVPLSFVGVMIAGGASAKAGLPVPFVEGAILISLFVLPAVAFLRWNISAALASALVGFFALFHGYAHGLEMPTSASGFDYGLGFVMATGLLHMTGIALGRLLSSVRAAAFH